MILGALLLAATFFSSGPHGGRAAALVAAPSDARVLYAGTPAGVLRSGDGGATWVRTGSGVSNVTLLAVDPADANTVYAVMTIHEYSGRVFKSSDAGATWTQLALPIGISPVALLVPEHDLVFVGSECQQFFSRGPEVQFHEAAGVFKSTDGGQTWQLPGSDPQTNPICVTDMTFDPANRSHLTVRLIYSGNMESFDGGTTWKTAAATTPTTRIVAHPTDPNIRYGITRANGGRPLLAVSGDAGVTWTKIEPVGLPTEDFIDFVSLEIDPSTGRLFLGTDRGVFRSGDGGRSWLPIGAVPQTRVDSTVVLPGTRRIITGTAFGLYTSDFPYGAAAMLPAADSATNIVRVVVDPTDPKRLFAASAPSPFGRFHGQVFRSVNGGLSWETIDDPNPQARPYLAVDAAGTLFAVSTFTDPAVYRLPRDGQALERLPLTFEDRFESINGVVADPVRPGVVYVLASLGIIGTPDGGQTWTRLNWSGYSPRSLAIDPTNPFVLYGTYSGGSFKVVDGVPLGMAAPNIFGPIVISPVSPSTLYAVFETVPYSGKHLLGRSDDAGESWSITTSPSFDDVITALAADPRDADAVWLATGKRGLLVSRDRGATWEDANANLPTRFVWSIAFDREGRAMHVGTDRGVWTMPLVKGRRRSAAPPR